MGGQLVGVTARWVLKEDVANIFLRYLVFMMQLHRSHAQRAEPAGTNRKKAQRVSSMK